MAPYIGIPEETASILKPGKNVTQIVIIENLASFNRYVREIKSSKEIVIYCAGFPSRSIQRTITSLCETFSGCVYHWGDIDVGGLQIANYISKLIKGYPCSFRLHMMSPELAQKHGYKVDPNNISLNKNIEYETKELIDLLQYFNTENVCFLEQETLDPHPP